MKKKATTSKRPGSKLASMSAKMKSMGPKLIARPGLKSLLGGRKPSSMAGKAKRR